MEGKVLVKNPNGASNAWKYFGFWKIGTKVCKDFAVCFECKQECKYSGSTSNLNEHLKRHHTETMPLPGKKSIQSQITTMMKQCKMFRCLSDVFLYLDGCSNICQG